MVCFTSWRWWQKADAPASADSTTVADSTPTYKLMDNLPITDISTYKKDKSIWAILFDGKTLADGVVMTRIQFLLVGIVKDGAIHLAHSGNGEAEW